MYGLRAGAAALLLTIGLGAAQAAPWGPQPAPGIDDFVEQTQMVCDRARCIDPNTGAYSQSTCTGGRCRPLGGIVGYDRPGGARQQRYGEPGWQGRRRGWDDEDRFERRRRWREDSYYERPRYRRPPPPDYEVPPPRWGQPRW